MAVFGDYALYYNLLYNDKNYAAESRFVLSCFERAEAKPESLLDLGCGTAKHALCMAHHGIQVCGVDMSETMLDMAKEALEQESPAIRAAVSLRQGDARAVRLPKTYQAVTALFHVMSYQNTPEDALALFLTAKAQLAPGGMFFFDFWHGPGVLADPPVYREKTLHNETLMLVRRATPIHDVKKKLVIVNYDIVLHHSQSGSESHLKESHSMRYWFVEELGELAIQAGLQPVASGGWPHHAQATVKDWNAWMLVRS